MSYQANFGKIGHRTDSYRSSRQIDGDDYKEKHRKEYGKMDEMSHEQLKKYARDKYHENDKTDFKARRRSSQIKGLQWILNQVQLQRCVIVPSEQAGSALIHFQKKAEAVQAQATKEQLYLGQHIYLNCNGCYENMNKGTHSPVLFLCGHVVCLQCTGGYIQSCNKLACPQCQTESPTLSFFGVSIM